MNYSTLTTFLATLLCSSLFLMQGVHAHTRGFCVSSSNSGVISIYAGTTHTPSGGETTGGIIIAGGQAGNEQFGSICAQPYIDRLGDDGGDDDRFDTAYETDDIAHDWLCGKRFNFQESIGWLTYNEVLARSPDVTCKGYQPNDLENRRFLGVDLEVDECGNDVVYGLSTTFDENIEYPNEETEWITFECEVGQAPLAIYPKCDLTASFLYSAQIASNVEGLAPLGHPKIQCNSPSICYLAPSAVQSLHKILESEPAGAQLRIETAYFGPLETYLINHWKDSEVCSNRQMKNLIEDPIPIEHSTGCAFDIDPTNLGRWKDTLISKGWEYTRPTIDKHHFEYLKCRDGVPASAGITAFQTLWNLNNPLEFPLVGGSFDPATVAAIGELMSGEGFATLPLSN